MMNKQSHWLFEILPLLDSELNLEKPMGRGKGWRRISPSYAVGRLPRFSGKPRFFVENHLRSQGFSPRPATANYTGSVTWIHSDGSQVRIDPAHRLNNPKRNPNPNIPGNIMSHERAHYHKAWSDGNNLLSLDDRGYVVNPLSSNAHIPAKWSKKQREFEFLFEVPFDSSASYYSQSGSEREYENQWLFELPYTSQEYYNSPSEADAMFSWAKKKWEQWKKSKARASPTFSSGRVTASNPSNIAPTDSELVRKLDNDPNPNRSLTKDEGDALTRVVTALIRKSILKKKQEIQDPLQSFERKQELRQNLTRLVNLGRFRFLRQIPQLRNSLIQALDGTNVKFPY
jgi:hypothetical protein